MKSKPACGNTQKVFLHAGFFVARMIRHEREIGWERALTDVLFNAFKQG